MTVTMQMTGMKELQRELAKLESLATRKNVGRRALRTAAQPLADLASTLAPEGETHNLEESVTVSTKLSPLQSKLHRKMFRDDRAAVEMFVGAGPLSSAHTQEFGTVFHPPQPFMRPAWDQDHRALMDRLGVELWKEVEKAVARAERRQAKG